MTRLLKHRQCQPEVACAQIHEDDRLYGKPCDNDGLLSIFPGHGVIVPLSNVVNERGHLADEVYDWIVENFGDTTWRFVLAETVADRAFFYVQDPKKAVLFRMFYG